MNYPINPLVSLAVWFVVAVAIAAIGFFRKAEELEQMAWAFVAMLWPAFLLIALMFSPIWIGFAVAKMIKRNSRLV